MPGDPVAHATGGVPPIRDREPLDLLEAERGGGGLDETLRDRRAEVPALPARGQEHVRRFRGKVAPVGVNGVVASRVDPYEGDAAARRRTAVSVSAFVFSNGSLVARQT